MNRNANIPSDRGQFGRKSDDPISVNQEVRTANSDGVNAELKQLKEPLDTKIIVQDGF